MRHKKIANVFRTATQQWMWVDADDVMIFGANFVSEHAAVRAAEALGYEAETASTLAAELDFT